MRVIVTHGENARVTFVREGENDREFEAVIRQVQPKRKHPEDVNEVSVFWETYTVREQ